MLGKPIHGSNREKGGLPRDFARRNADHARVPSRKRLIDGLCAAAIILGTLGLFLIDIRSPRGILDGLGYPAIVALSSRFGRRAVTVCTLAVIVLIVLGAFLVPDAGVSIAGELANRFFGLLSVGIVALVLNQRFGLEHFIATRETTLALHQQALLEAVHQVLLTNLPFQSRVRNLTEIAAKSLEVGRVSIFRWREGNAGLECLDVYHPLEDRHEIIPDVAENRHPDYLDAMRASWSWSPTMSRTRRISPCAAGFLPRIMSAP